MNFIATKGGVETHAICPHCRKNIDAAAMGPIYRIQMEVCQEYGISRQELLSTRQAPKYVKPRHIAMARCIDETAANYNDIGRLFNRHRASVRLAHRKYGKRPYEHVIDTRQMGQW